MRKKIILIVIIFILLFLDMFLFLHFIYGKYRNKKFIETYDLNIANEIKSSDFQINKVIIYSSASGKNKNTNFQSSNWILDIFQYADIAIYFSKPDILNPCNTIQSLKISNVKYNVSNPKYAPSLYYLDGSNFGTDKFLEEYKIEDIFEYNILNFDNEDNSIKYNTPVFFSDLSNPITLKFTNTLFKSYSIKNTEKLIFDGHLLDKTSILLRNLENSVSFDIIIKNYNDETYLANVNIKIPLENSEGTVISKGSIVEKNDVNIKFLKQ